jgi:hypothetical protein
MSPFLPFACICLASILLAPVLRPHRSTPEPNTEEADVAGAAGMHGHVGPMAWRPMVAT